MKHIEPKYLTYLVLLVGLAYWIDHRIQRHTDDNNPYRSGYYGVPTMYGLDGTVVVSINPFKLPKLDP